jgi:hypothetical protein
MYTQILKFLGTDKGSIQGITQPVPLFYTTNLQMGWYQRAMIVRNIKAGVSDGQLRPEAIIEYWRECGSDKANELFYNTLQNLLWH